MDSDRSAQRQYEEEVIAAFRRLCSQPSISSSDLASEYTLQVELHDAWALFKDVVNRVNANSSLIKIDVRACEDFAHDELPSEQFWNERIEYARRGWEL